MWEPIPCGQKTVRREKAAIFQRVQIPSGDGSLQPEAIGAAVEVTKLPKPSMQRAALAAPRSDRPKHA